MSEEKNQHILDQIFTALDIKTLRNTTQVHAAAVPTDLPADTACAKLIRDWGLRVESELDAAALAASFEFPFRWLDGGGCGWMLDKDLWE